MTDCRWTRRKYRDEVDNEFVRGRMENVVRVATSDDIRVTFGDGCHTDMQGTIQVDPYDLGKNAAPEDRIIMMQGGLEHEICHELYYDKAAFGELQKQVEDDPTRAPAAYLNNVLADGHDEWRHKLDRPEAYEMIEAHDALFVASNGSGRWSFDPDKQDTWQQVTGAMLYRGLPYYQVPEDKLSPEALDAYRECSPHVDAAVAGTSWDCLREANEIHDILKRRGVVPQNPDTDHLDGGSGPGAGGPPGLGQPGNPPGNPPGPGEPGGEPGGGEEGGSGNLGSAPGELDRPLTDEEREQVSQKNAPPPGEANDDSRGGYGSQNESQNDVQSSPASATSWAPAGGRDGSEGDDASGESGGGGTTSGEGGRADGGSGPEDAGPNVDNAGDAADGNSAGAQTQGATNQDATNQDAAEGGGSRGDDSSGSDSSGSRSHPASNPFTADSKAGQEALDNRRSGARSLAATARNQKPQPSHRNDPDEQVHRTSDALSEFRERWGCQRRTAQQFAAVIEEARTETLAPKSRQESGRLDRSRRRALATGDSKVFTRRGKARKADMSVEVLLDVSGSMAHSIPALKDSAAIVSQGLDGAKNRPRGKRLWAGDVPAPLPGVWREGRLEARGHRHRGHYGVGSGYGESSGRVLHPDGAAEAGARDDRRRARRCGRGKGAGSPGAT